MPANYWLASSVRGVVSASDRVNAASNVLKMSNKPWDPPVEPEVVLLVNTIINNAWSQLGWQSLVSLDISRIGNSNTCLMLMEKDEFWKPSNICCVYFHVCQSTFPYI